MWLPTVDFESTASAVSPPRRSHSNEFRFNQLPRSRATIPGTIMRGLFARAKEITAAVSQLRMRSRHFILHES